MTLILMEVVIMEHQGILQIKQVYKFAIIAFLLFVSCQKEEVTTLELLTSNDNLHLINGVLHLNENLFNGRLVEYYDENKLKLEVFYKNGKKHGHEKKWYTNDTLAEIRFYSNGNKSGIHEAWWPNKNKKFEYHFNEKGEYHGEVLEWYKTGQRFRAFNYINGQEVGSQQLWQLDGRIKGNYEVVNGERFGLIGLKKCYTVTRDNDEVKKENTYE